MKFSPENWKEVKSDEKIELPQGRLWLRLTQESNVFVTSLSGIETLVGYDKEIDVEVTDVAYMTFDNPKARGWLFERPSEAYHSEGEIFTNADRMPDESGTMNEVTKALRLFELGQRRIIREARQELAEVQAERAALSENGTEAQQTLDDIKADDDDEGDPPQADPAPAPKK